jgi:HD-GYP domain-containing protein (c-di-GMP phosphodiesterase class II)
MKRGDNMLFIEMKDLKSGMRLARPIYNKMGVLLYERDTKLTPQGISSIRNFGLIGLYILEPAEPAPPMTEMEIQFEQFLTVSLFQLKDDMILLGNGKPPQNLQGLAATMLKNYGGLKQKISFLQNVRSSSDYVYKHCVSTAILTAMIVGDMKFSPQDRVAIICAALLHDIGKLLVPPELLVKEDLNQLDKDERRQIRKALERGYSLLQPETNIFNLPKLCLQIVGQLTHYEHNPQKPLDPTIKWHPGAQVIHVAEMYDSLTAMRLGHKPDSVLAAIRFLSKHPNHYARNLVAILSRRINILPSACCVDLSNGDKGIILRENPNDFMKPVIVRFSDNQIFDLSDPEVRKKIQVLDIMQTMDNRIKTDEETLKQFKSDPISKAQMDRFLKKWSQIRAQVKPSVGVPTKSSTMNRTDR